MPRISVIIPAYNRPELLRIAVGSVAAQTFTDWECIVVDDGSVEDIRFVTAIDGRVRLHRQENLGVSVARNVGMSMASGELLAFLDSDDIWLPEKLSRQVAAIEGNPTATLCCCACRHVDGSGREIGTEWAISPVDYLSMLAGQLTVIPSVSVVPRTAALLAGGFDPLLTLGEDYDFFMRVARLGSIVYVPERLVLYRFHGENATRQYVRTFRTMEVIRRKHLNFALARGDSAACKAAKQNRWAVRRGFGVVAYESAREAVARGEFAQAMAHLWRAANWNPSFLCRSLVAFFRERIRCLIHDGIGR